MMYKKWMRCAGVFVVVLAVFAMLSPDVMSAKETLVIGLQDDSRSLDPAVAAEATSIGFINQMYQKLLTFALDDFTKPILELAESWDVSSDGKTWVFHLRQEMVFASGNPIAADDVIFSLRRVLKFNGNIAWLLTQFGMKEEGISKLDDVTVQIVLDKQYAPELFLACVAHGIASILDQKTVMAHEENGDLGSAWLANHSAGSGRFVLAKRKQGETLILKANPAYSRRDKVTTIAKLTVKNVPEPIEQAILLGKGEIDIAWNLGASEVKQLETDQNVQILQTPLLALYYVGMNLGYEPLTKLQVRNAIRYAINYDAITDLILQKTAVKIQTIIPKGILGYNPAMPYTLDVAKAKQLLADAGYPNGFNVELLTLDFAPWSDLALQIKSDLAKIGINVTIPSVPVAQAMDRLFSTREFQLSVTGWEFDYPDPDSMAKPFAHSNRPGDDATVKATAWNCKYVNPELAALVDQAAQELDAAKREAMYAQITNTLLEDGPFAVLNVPMKQFGVRLDAKDFIGFPSFLSAGFPTLR